jgi:hypothetical protein
MMANVLDLLAAVRRAGGDVKLAGPDRLRLIAPAPVLPALAAQVRAAKPLLIAVLASTSSHAMEAAATDRTSPLSAAEWHTRHREALAYWSALHPADEAAVLAWGEIEDRWHRLHGARWPAWQCAGCDQPIGGLPAMTLADGSRVHLGKLSCLLCFGRRWRSAASSALRSFGIEPPPRL